MKCNSLGLPFKASYDPFMPHHEALAEWDLAVAPNFRVAKPGLTTLALRHGVMVLYN